MTGQAFFLESVLNKAVIVGMLHKLWDQYAIITQSKQAGAIRIFHGIRPNYPNSRYDCLLSDYDSSVIMISSSDSSL